MNDRIYIRMKNYLMSFIYPILFAIPISPITAWFEKYVFNDWGFVKFLVVLMCVDTVMGFIYHLMKKDFSLEGFEKIFIKLICYGSALIVAHNLSSYTILGSPVSGFAWFRVAVCTALIVREGLSIFNLIDKISPDIVPPRIKKYLKYYDEEGKFPSKDNSLINKDKENEII